MQGRDAAWTWEDRLELRRTRTSHSERWAKGCAYLRWVARRWEERAHRSALLWRSFREVEPAIRFVFGSRAEEAIDVAGCESGDRDGDLSPHVVRAHNGQYLGMFQMGDGERRRFGHGGTPYEQAKAAHAYFVNSGSDWSPWSCQPG